ncbi:kinase-like domain-containing protein [Tricladium varicosporioides]|nr:kinase-like domain-containing protein [Hymenoscyphus varicosporioides]
MPSFDLDHKTASNDEIAAYCSNPNHISFTEACYDNCVVKLSDEAVVKFGIGVKEEEAKSLKRAYELVDHNIIRVPFVYRFFMKEQQGYIIMEYMQGRVLKSIEDPVLMKRIADILAYLTSIRGSTPGALGGGVSCGILWSEHSEEPFLHTVKDMENWFNMRLKKQDPKLIFGTSELVLCHLDIAPRNILLLQDNSLCLLDWASAGFYPRVFEECVIRITRGLRDHFNEDVLKLGDLTEKEEIQITSMMLAYYNSVRFHFRPLQTLHETNLVEHNDDNPDAD